MTSDERAGESAHGLTVGYRLIRHVSGAGESPWPGVLTSTPHGELGVVVDVGAFPEKWRGWDAGASGHLLAPLDVLRRADGQDVLLPVCTERVTDFIERRSAARAALSDGEAVTLVVSVLRGVAELGDAAASATGAWWLTDAGRPVLATDSNDDSVLQSTSALLRELGEGTPALDRPIRMAIEALERGTCAREIDHLENLLFAVDAPSPLAINALGPKAARARVRDLAPVPRAEVVAEPTGLVSGLARHLDSDWADLVSRTTTGLWRAARTRRPHAKRTPWMLAAAIAGLVLVGGLMWPFEDDNVTTADADVIEAAEPSSAPDTGTGTTENSEQAAAAESQPATDDLAAITTALLSARSGCAQDAACLSTVQESPTSTFAGGVIDLDATARSVTMLDEFGGVAVLRVDAAAGSVPSQLVVVVRIDEKWLLRDVHDVAQQP